MHKNRLQSPLRWLAAMIIVFGSVLYVAMSPDDPMRQNSAQELTLKTSDISAPSENELTLARQGFSAAQRLVRQPDPNVMQASLFSPGKEEKTETGKRLELIIVGGHHNLAMINNELYEKGDILPDGYTIMAIKPKWVHLQKGSRRQRLDLKDAHHVKLH